MLSAQPNIAVLVDVATLDAAVAAATRTHPDIVLLTVGDDLDDWSELVHKLATTGSTARLLLLTTARDTLSAVEAVERGARGVVHTDQSPEVLFKALRKVQAGEIWLERSGFAALLEQRRHKELSPEQSKIRSLTRREREIITLIGEGLKNQQVAGRLMISQDTVRNHLTSILDKLGVTDRFELTLFGLRHGLLQCPACGRTHGAHKPQAPTFKPLRRKVRQAPGKGSWAREPSP